MEIESISVCTWYIDHPIKTRTLGMATTSFLDRVCCKRCRFFACFDRGCKPEKQSEHRSGKTGHSDGGVEGIITQTATRESSVQSLK
jgi:hypothetical protein